MVRSTPCLFLASALLGLTAARPAHAGFAFVKRRDELEEEYDYIVVGAGTAGLTVADRLSENGESTVLVIEYGYLDSSHSITTRGPDAQAPGVEEYPSGSRYYNITSVPQPFLDGKGRAAQAGAVVGGSSAVNGMLFDRGSAADYDSWVWAAGEWQDIFAEEWGWDKLLPYFKKSVTFHPPAEETAREYGITWDTEAAYGGTTPIHSSYTSYQWPVQQLMWDAFKTIPGIDFPKEGADGHAVGVFWCPNSINPITATRSYSKIGHYDIENGPKYRDNFHLLPGHRVTQVILDQLETEGRDIVWEATGVMFTPRDGEMPDKAWRIKARKEVVLSAGALHSPQVLQRSGIGPRNILESAGVGVKVALPGVGYNFQDHYIYSIGYRWLVDVSPTSASLSSDPEFREWAMELWEANKTGPFSAFVNSGAFLPLSVITDQSSTYVNEVLSQDPAAHLPEDIDSTVLAGYKVQLQVLARQFNSTDNAVLEMPFSGSSSFSVVDLKPLSRGVIYISPEDDGVTETGRGDMEPIVDYRAFTNPLDLPIMEECLSFIRNFMKSDAMVKALNPDETSPGEEYEIGSEKLADWIRSAMRPSVGHPVGTCSMGPIDLGGVVSADLTVYGTKKLSVADNSIMTLIPGTHTSSTAYAIGEKAADLIKKRTGWKQAEEKKSKVIYENFNGEES